MMSETGTAAAALLVFGDSWYGEEDEEMICGVKSREIWVRLF